MFRSRYGLACAVLTLMSGVSAFAPASKPFAKVQLSNRLAGADKPPSIEEETSPGTLRWEPWGFPWGH